MLRELSTAEIDTFRSRGVLWLRHAFTEDTAQAVRDFIFAELERLHGIRASDRSTWTLPHGHNLWGAVWPGLNRSAEHPVYQRIGTPRLLGAVHDLLGGEPRLPKRWGGFLTNPPDSVFLPPGAPPPAWRVPAEGWHWDGRWQPGSSSSAVWVFTFFGSVPPRAGGTLLVEGSGQLLDAFMLSLSEHERSAKQSMLRERFCRFHPWIAQLTGHALPADYARARSPEELMREYSEPNGVRLRVVEATGEPGDAILCHPHILHARPPQHGDEPRLMAVTALSREHPRSEQAQTKSPGV